MLEMPMEMTSALPFCDANKSPSFGNKDDEGDDSNSNVVEGIPAEQNAKRM